MKRIISAFMLFAIGTSSVIGMQGQEEEEKKGPSLQSQNQKKDTSNKNNQQISYYDQGKYQEIWNNMQQLTVTLYNSQKQLKEGILYKISETPRIQLLDLGANKIQRKGITNLDIYAFGGYFFNIFQTQEDKVNNAFFIEIKNRYFSCQQEDAINTVKNQSQNNYYLTIYGEGANADIDFCINEHNILIKTLISKDIREFLYKKPKEIKEKMLLFMYKAFFPLIQEAHEKKLDQNMMIAHFFTNIPKILEEIEKQIIFYKKCKEYEDNILEKHRSIKVSKKSFQSTGFIKEQTVESFVDFDFSYANILILKKIGDCYFYLDYAHLSQNDISHPSIKSQNDLGKILDSSNITYPKDKTYFSEQDKKNQEDTELNKKYENTFNGLVNDLSSKYQLTSQGNVYKFFQHYEGNYGEILILQNAAEQQYYFVEYLKFTPCQNEASQFFRPKIDSQDDLGLALTGSNIKFPKGVGIEFSKVHLNQKNIKQAQSKKSKNPNNQNQSFTFKIKDYVNGFKQNIKKDISKLLMEYEKGYDSARITSNGNVIKYAIDMSAQDFVTFLQNFCKEKNIYENFILIIYDINAMQIDENDKNFFQKIMDGNNSDNIVIFDLRKDSSVTFINKSIMQQTSGKNGMKKYSTLQDFTEFKFKFQDIYHIISSVFNIGIDQKEFDQQSNCGSVGFNENGSIINLKNKQISDDQKSNATRNNPLDDFDGLDNEDIENQEDQQYSNENSQNKSLQNQK